MNDPSTPNGDAGRTFTGQIDAFKAQVAAQPPSPQNQGSEQLILAMLADASPADMDATTCRALAEEGLAHFDQAEDLGDRRYVEAIRQSIRSAADTPEHRALVNFARWVITSSSFAGSDLCGGQVQEVAHKLGLLEEISVSEPCGESCGCAEVGDWPATCYRFAPALADPSHAEAPEAQPAVDAAEPPRSPAAAAIEFALEAGEGFTFLRLWNEGCFDEIRAEWPEAPEAVFIGADPMHNKGEMK